MNKRLKFMFVATVSTLALAAGSAQALPFNYTGAVEDYVIPVAGIYTVTARGAQGGAGQGFDGANYAGGRGAQVSGTFYFPVNTLLHIAVGREGASGYGNGGGGGGSFVVQDANTPLVIGGGGGGIRSYAHRNGFDANTGRSGLSGSGYYGNGTGGGVPTGNDGEGGQPSSYRSYGSGGGGFNSNGGEDVFCNVPGAGGRSWFNGLQGGTSLSDDGNGGFGGGGAGAGCDGGGGGGGYSGGDGGFIAGGGGSFLADGAGNRVFLAGLGYGNGYVSIDPVNNAVPEPTSLGLFGLSLAGLALLRRRRQG